MSERDPILELFTALRDSIEDSATAGSFDTDAALATLGQLEKATRLLRRVSLHSFHEFENRIHQLSMLSSIGRIFNSVFDLDEMCRALLELVIEAVPCQNAFFSLSTLCDNSNSNRR